MVITVQKVMNSWDISCRNKVRESTVSNCVGDCAFSHMGEVYIGMGAKFYKVIEKFWFVCLLNYNRYPSG